MPKEWKKNKADAPKASEPTEPFGADLLAAEIGQDIPQVDLHGMREDEAEREVEHFINTQFAAGKRAARIVHGKGLGSLRRVAQRVLADYVKKDIVAAYRDSSYALGAVTVFALHPNE